MLAAHDLHASTWMTWRLPALLWTLGCMLGCAKRYPLPMTAAELSGHADGGALVAYLSQPDASASVCDPLSPGPHFARMDEDARKALARAFHDGKIAPELWRRCVAAMLHGSDAVDAGALLGDVLDTAVAAIEDRDLEFDARAQARVDALLQVYADRDARLLALPGPARAASSALRRDLQKKSVGSIGQERAADLATLLQLEQGLWKDLTVDASALDAMADAKDERTLRWAVARLPEAALRAEARRRVVRMHIAESPFPEVRDDPAAVEETVLRSGRNAVALDHHAPLRGSIAPALAYTRTVVVQQRVPEQSARLLGYSSDRPTPAVLPELPLRGGLHVALEGISIPVTVCAPAEELDVTPCLAPEEVHADASLAYVDQAGVLRFVDSIGESAAVDLARRGRHLGLSFTVAARRVASLDWPLTFAAPADLVLTGSEHGAAGPNLDVRVDARDPARLVYSVSDGRLLQAVVEREDVGSFHVVSRGARGRSGASGTSGTDGASGSDGWSASCPSSPGSDGSRGGDGSPGGAGGPGGPGGAGGDVRVSVLAAGGAREDLLAVLRTTLRSEGGAGGPGGGGGRGGSGGRGGRGGSGTTCTDAEGHVTMLSGGSDGWSGGDGSAGADGPDGPSGPSGHVTFSSSP